MKTAIYIQGQSGRLGQKIFSEIQKNGEFVLVKEVKRADVVIDVSAPSGLADILTACLKARKPIVIGTTGYKDIEKTMMQEAAKYIPLLYTPNFSLGMTLLKAIVSKLAEKMKEAHIQIIEEHHSGKKDSPSGSAIALQQAIRQENISIESKRIDDVTGKHTVIFELEGEKLKLEHEVLCRSVFAKGALQAALFLKTQSPGYYESIF